MEYLGSELPVEYLGSELPVEYLGNPAKLAADWDALIFCGYNSVWNDGWAPLIQSYVTEYGRGFLAAMDFVGIELDYPDFEHMNPVVEPSGITFDAVHLDWADATASVSMCIPDLISIR